MTQDPLLGRQLATYRIERLIGSGGMAQVYYGWDVKLERPVAIKVIDARYRDDSSYAQRFVHEAQAVAAWRHENIVQIYYADDEDGLYYFAMEYIDGLDLGRLLAQYADDGEWMDYEDVLLVGRAVASALDYAHQEGVIHRDVKPSNVMVTSKGRVVLTDFGLAMDVYRGTLGETFGSPHYISPEQARSSANAIPQSDLYSLGVMFYEMLTGVVPFDDPSATAVALQHLTETPPSPRQLNSGLNAEIEAVLLKALSKSPEERYQTGKELVDALEKAMLADQPVSAPQEKMELPPLPPGVQPPAARAPSRMSVSERASLCTPIQVGPSPVTRTSERPNASLLGVRLDEYRLDALLGQGGMARIYRGLDVNLKRRVAIKVIDTPLRTDVEYMARFKREAQAIAKLEHPHIVRLYRYGEADGLLYMAMQYVDGADLESVLADYHTSRSFMEPQKASRIVREICLALDYAHSQGVIHRDVKPSNIILDKQGRVYLADFGLALLTESGTRGEIFGSPRYIAPEQAISSANVVPQSDLYAVGIILYEMFAGVTPFNAEDPLDIAMLQMDEPPRPPRAFRPEISPELEAVILKALEKHPQDRYRNGAELADALDRALGMITGETRSQAQETFAPLPSEGRADRTGTPLSVPVPVAVAPSVQPAQEKSPSAAPASLAPVRKRGPVLIYAGLGLGACAIVTALAVVVLLLTSGSIQSLLSRSTPAETQTPISAITESATPMLSPPVVATSTRQSPTKAPFFSTPFPTEQSPTKAASTIAPTPTPTATSTPEPASSYEILIAKRAEDGMFVINASAQDFPLARLQLGDDTGRVDGVEWGVLALSPGDCVVVWKDKGEPSLPGKVECNQVGNVLIRSKPDIFWEQWFYTYYDGQVFGGCDKGEAECPVHISTDAGYLLHIAKRGDESLFVLNLSPRNLALAPLQLGDGAGQVKGTDWGKLALGNGECAAVWKDDGDPRPPDRVECEPIGERLTRAKEDRFWKATFDIYYDGSLIGTCKKERKNCFVYMPGD